MSARRREENGIGGQAQQQQQQGEEETLADEVTANDSLLSSPSSRRRPSKSIGGESMDTSSVQGQEETGMRGIRGSGRGILPCDDDASGVYPCPVPYCDAPPFDNRATRNFHMRTDHAGYTYRQGDYERKIALGSKPPDEMVQKSKPRQRASSSRVQKEPMREKLFEMEMQEVKPKDMVMSSGARGEGSLRVEHSQDHGGHVHEHEFAIPAYSSHFDIQESHARRAETLAHSSSSSSHSHTHGNRFSPLTMQVQQQGIPMNSVARSYTIEGEQYSPHEIQVGAEEIYTMEEATMYETDQILSEDYEKMDEEDRKMMDAFYPPMHHHTSRLNILRGKRRGRPKNDEGQEPGPTSKIRLGDPNGKYGCYIKTCPWRGGYRSIRAAHMKWCHKDWVMPSRFMLQRMSREATFLHPQGQRMEELEPEFTCLVDGCPWKGNFRATRAAHMRTHHPEFEYPKKKASIGGYIPDGKYMCHIPGCDWRGSSRSTRATHMRKEHPGVKSHNYPSRTVACADCEMQCNSHKHFVDHSALEHHIGGIVQREFSDIRDYEEWFGAVQEAFSIEFIRRMNIKQTEHYQVMYMYCARSGGYRPRRMRSTPAYTPEYTKRRTVRSKIGKNCTAFLRIVNWTDGHITVVGCIEHTGHRMGTALLRVSPQEREVMDEYLYLWEEDASLEMALERLREMDGYSIDGYEASAKRVDDVKAFIIDDNELMSLNKLAKDQLKNCVFGVELTDANGELLTESFAFGLMTPQMRDLWIKHSHRAVCIEEVHLMLGGKWDVSMYFAMVFDERDVPRCAAVYLSSQSDHEKLLRHLADIYENGRQLDTIVTDGSQEWMQAFASVFPDKVFNMDLQIAEWHVLSDWTVHVDHLVPNKVDKFQILCALRRWLRTTDMPMFETIVVDLFEALKEMELDELLAYLDAQLMDPDLAKRWVPMNRESLTDHSNPTLEVTCRILREKFLNCDFCTRLDEYIGLLAGRIQEFNAAQPSPVFTTKPPDPPRGLPPPIYDDIDASQMQGEEPLEAILIETAPAGHQQTDVTRMRQQTIREVMEHDGHHVQVQAQGHAHPQGQSYDEEEMIVVNMDELIDEDGEGQRYERVIVIEQPAHSSHHVDHLQQQHQHQTGDEQQPQNEEIIDILQAEDRQRHEQAEGEGAVAEHEANQNVEVEEGEQVEEQELQEGREK